MMTMITVVIMMVMVMRLLMAYVMLLQVENVASTRPVLEATLNFVFLAL